MTKGELAKLAGVEDRLDFALPQPWLDAVTAAVNRLDCDVLSWFLGWYYAPGDHFGRPMTVGEGYALAEARGLARYLPDDSVLGHCDNCGVVMAADEPRIAVVEYNGVGEWGGDTLFCSARCYLRTVADNLDGKKI